MRYITLLLLCGGIAQATVAQQITLSGQVSIHNSEYNTGKMAYVKGAHLQADFTSPAESGDQGEFKLEFVGIKRGTTVNVQAEKAGFELVNKREMQDVIVGRRLPLRVYLAPKGQLAKAQTELYNVNVNALTARYDRMIARLRRDGAEQQAALAELEEQLGRTIANRFEAEDLLSAQLESLKQRLPEVAKELATVNLDFASEMYRRAYEYFKAGETEKTLEALDEAILDAEARKVLEEIRYLNPGIADLDSARQDKLAEMIVRVETYRLKGDLLRESLKPQAAVAEYEKALNFAEQYFGPEHPTTAVTYSSLALALKDLGDYQGAKTLLEKTMDVMEKTFGLNHPTTAGSYINFGMVLAKIGDYALARYYLQKARSIFRGSLGDEHPNNQVVINLLNQIDTIASKPKDCISIFPWPPPQPSARHEIPNDFFGKAKTLGDIKHTLSKALDQCGYSERSYYCVLPEGGSKGFALVARMEQIDEKAFPLPLPDRWSVELRSSSSFSLSEILRSLFFKKPGYFRIVAFIVYDEPFKPSAPPLTRGEGMRLLHDGANRLSSEIAAIPFSKDFSCTALIYEFEVPESGREPRQVENSRHTGKEHLIRAKLLEALQIKK